MLTDRQQNFFDRISTLSKNTSISEREVTVLSVCRDNILAGKNFRPEINGMCLKLREIENRIALSFETKQLYYDLIQVYGEAEYPTNFHRYEEKVETDWKRGEDGLIYAGFGGVSRWHKKEDLSSGKVSIKSQVIPFLKLFLTGNFLLFFSFAFIFPWFRERIGSMNFFIIMSVLGLSFISLLIFFGRFKKNNI